MFDYYLAFGITVSWKDIFQSTKFHNLWPFTFISHWDPGVIRLLQEIGSAPLNWRTTIHLNVFWQFTNVKRRENTGQICPLLSTRIRTLSPRLEGGQSGLVVIVLRVFSMLQAYLWFSRKPQNLFWFLLTPYITCFPSYLTM